MPIRFQTLSLNDTAADNKKSPPRRLDGDVIRPTAKDICLDVLQLWREQPVKEYSSNIETIKEELSNRNPLWDFCDMDLTKILKEFNIYIAENEESSLNTFNTHILFPSIDSFPSSTLLTDSCVALKECKEDENLKGRGLFASESLTQGQELFKNIKPLIQIPPLDKLSLIQMGKVCSLCGNTFKHSSQFIMTHNLDCNNCSSVWCSKECKSNDITHDYLKHLKSKVKAIIPSNWIKFQNFCKETSFYSAYAIGIIYTAMKIDENKKSPNLNINSIFGSFATISQNLTSFHEFSFNNLGTLDKETGSLIPCKDLNEVCIESFDLFKKTFSLSDTDFKFETYLDYIGRFNINQISGQLYPIANFFNHNCEPNVHYEIANNNLSMKIITRRNINKNDELFITYVNPLHGVKVRRRHLLQGWGFLCHCTRCKKELESRHNLQVITTSSIVPNIIKTNDQEGNIKPGTLLNVHKVSIDDKKRRKSSMKASKPELKELLKNGEEFELDIPENIGFNNRRTSVRFNNDVTVAVEE